MTHGCWEKVRVVPCMSYTLQEMPDVTIHGNQVGRWADCKVCALRLGYWPRVGARGRPAAGPPPETVRAAFDVLREPGCWECCKAADTRAALQLVARQARVDRLAPMSGKATPRPANCGAGTAAQKPAQPKQRAASVASNGKASRPITVAVTVNAVRDARSVGHGLALLTARRHN